MSSVQIPASEWDAIPRDSKARSDFLRSKGVPIDEDGCWMPNFDGIECKTVGDSIVWVYYWND